MTCFEEDIVNECREENRFLTNRVEVLEELLEDRVYEARALQEYVSELEERLDMPFGDRWAF